MSISVVVGAGYGDEGKGGIVDFLVNERRASTVVRYCGGPQAAHTVNIPASDNTKAMKKVFHMLGSGTLRGADTLLTSDVLVSPEVLVSDMDAVRFHTGIFPRVSCDKGCDIIIPQDVAISRLFGRRHGTCGAGVNEAIQRSRYPLLDTKMGSALDIVARTVDSPAMKNYLRFRLLTLIGQHPEFNNNAASQSIEHKLLDAMNWVSGWCEEHGDGFLASLVKLYSRGIEFYTNRAYPLSAVFESSQGLLLDRQLGLLPHVTNAEVGVPRFAFECADQSPGGSMTVYYVMRTYMTRHGPGPLLHELDARPDHPAFRDSTNYENGMQGKLRFAPLNLDLISAAIQADMARVTCSLSGPVGIKYGVALTHCDALSFDGFQMYYRGQLLSPFGDTAVARLDNLCTFIKTATGLDVCITGSGPLSTDIKWA